MRKKLGIAITGILFALVALRMGSSLPSARMQNQKFISKVNKREAVETFIEGNAKLTKSKIETLLSGLQSTDEELRAETARMVRVLLVEWVSDIAESDWSKDPERNLLFQQLKNSQDREFNAFLELNPNSRAAKYLREM